jgi:hypothetical protein
MARPPTATIASAVVAVSLLAEIDHGHGVTVDADAWKWRPRFRGRLP